MWGVSEMANSNQLFRLHPFTANKREQKTNELANRSPALLINDFLLLLASFHRLAFFFLFSSNVLREQVGVHGSLR